jgi:hypothetical protein
MATCLPDRLSSSRSRQQSKYPIRQGRCRRGHSHSACVLVPPVSHCSGEQMSWRSGKKKSGQPAHILPYIQDPHHSNRRTRITTRLRHSPHCIEADGALIHWSLPEKQKIGARSNVNGNVIDTVPLHESAVTILFGLQLASFHKVRWHWRKTSSSAARAHPCASALRMPDLGTFTRLWPRVTRPTTMLHKNSCHESSRTVGLRTLCLLLRIAWHARTAPGLAIRRGYQGGGLHPRYLVRYLVGCMANHPAHSPGTINIHP